MSIIRHLSFAHRPRGAGKSRLRKGLEVFLARCAAWAGYVGVRWLSLSGLYRLADGLGWVLSVVYRRRVVRSNLRIAFPEKTEAERRLIARRFYRHLARVILEFLYTPRISDEDVRQRVDFVNPETLAGLLERGRGAILFTAHFGNWEWMGRRIAMEGFPRVRVFARVEADRATGELTTRIREKSRLVVLDRSDVRGALRCLRHNEVLGILYDQATRLGAPIDLFGRPAATNLGPIRLARRSGAGICFSFCARQRDGRYRFEIQTPFQLLPPNDPAADDAADGRQFNRILEDVIREYPEQWLWTHRRWKVRGEG